MTIDFFRATNALDRECLFEQQLEDLRREYHLTSQKLVLAAQAQALIAAYHSGCKTTQARVLAYWKA